MKSSNTSDSAYLRDIGRRLAAWRLARNLTQQALADDAGVGIRTVQRLESGSTATQLSGFVSICRALGLLDHLDAVIPGPPPSPMAQLRLNNKQRKRATREPRRPARKKWTWDDQT